MAELSFTLEQVQTAQRELRDAAGVPYTGFSLEQTIALLSSEILLLRERGFSNQSIADLLAGFDIPVTPDDLVLYFRDPS
jgi:hypothetical protein